MPVIIAIRLWAAKAPGAALSVFKRWPLHCVIVLLLCLSVWLWRGWNHERADFTGYRTSAEQSVAKLKAEKAAIETRQAVTTKDTDHATPIARNAALDAARKYAADHRCMSPAPVIAARAEGDGVPGAAATSRGVEASGEAVAVAPEALDACTLNTSDLQQAYEWAAKQWGNQ